MFEIVSFYSSIDDAGRYFENIEVIDTASNLEEANVIFREYEMAFGNDFRIEFARVQFLESALRPHMLEFPTYIQIEKQMAISLEMIKESKGIVVSTLIEHFNAKPSELIMFERALASDEDWTCGFEDELLPLFLEVRSKMKKERSI